jgi:membrane-associated phospholipid phosphatase
VNGAVQDTIVVARRDATASPVRDLLRSRSVRKSEWVILSFLVYAVALACLLPVPPSTRHLVALVNVTILAAYPALIVADRARSTIAFAVARDAVSLALVVLAYREMGWFALPHPDHALEQSWVTWDRLALRGGMRAAIESLGPVIPSILEIAYALVYALAPFAIAILYAYKRREMVDEFLFIFAVGVLLCYAQFPFWPSEPPRVVFLGDNLPSYDTVFRRFNLWMLGNYGIHTSVFPSAHVAGAFAAAFGTMRALPERRWVGRFLLAIASLIAIATVYGRYHYLCDVWAGLLMALLALVFGCLAKRHTTARQSSKYSTFEETPREPA